jgi:uncharacterized membrane protein (UPF0127 family)
VSRFVLALLVAACLFPAGCEESPAGISVVKMRIGKQTYNLEVARTETQQEKGLMKRDSMPDDHGMIFVFPDEEMRSFWMKNTRFPLDILFVGAGGKVVSIHQMRAYDESNTSSDLPAQYAIELNKGQAGASGVKVGDVLDIPAGAHPSDKSRADTQPVR